MTSKEDIKFMKIAINMAKAGNGKTGVNPSVGCVIVKDNFILAKSSTAEGGKPHAEPIAIKEAGNNCRGATLYTTLEPCNHHGKNPPCSDAIIASGIKRVVIGIKDPNPVATGGIEKLEKAGIEVRIGICDNEAKSLHKPFIHKMTKKRPYVIVKIASTLDGKIALANGTSKWITNDISRTYSQMLRKKSDAIVIGVNTVINDNPELTCRLPGLEKKLPKIILDTAMRTPHSSKLIKNAEKEPVIIFSAREGNAGKAEVIKTPTNKDNNFVDLHYVLKVLAERGFERILVEGGGRVISSFIKENLVDELHLIYAPKVMGNNSISFSSELHLGEIPADKFTIAEQRKLGDDLLIRFLAK